MSYNLKFVYISQLASVSVLVRTFLILPNLQKKLSLLVHSVFRFTLVKKLCFFGFSTKAITILEVF